MADIDVKLKLTADGSVLVSTTSQAEGAVGELGEATVKAGRQASQGFDIAAKGSANLKAEMTEARNTAVELAAAFGGLTAIKGLAIRFIDAADAQGQLDARMRRVTEGAAEQAAATARLQQIAHDAYEDINRLTEVFVRSMEVTRQLGLSTAQTLDITEALALSMVVSASAADKRQQSIDALSKSMQNGYIAAEQLEGILAGAPRFVTALEDALGKTRAELVGMARDGELTIDMVTRVSSELETLRAEVEDMPTTVGDAVLRWGNAFQAWASSTNEVYGSTAALVALIDVMSANIDGVMLAAMMAATAATGVLVHQGALWIVSLYQQAAASKLKATATLDAARADLLQQQQQQAAAIAFQRAAQADIARAEAALAAATANQAAARASGLRATSEIAMARASIAATQADIAAAGATASLGAARAALVRANTATVQSNAAVAASQRGVDTALAATKQRIVSLSGVISLAVAGLMGWQFGTYLREQFIEVERFGIAMVGGLLNAWERLKAFGIAAWEGIKAAALGAVNSIRSAAATLVGALASANEATDLLGVKSGITAKLREMEQQLRPTTSAWDGFKTALGKALDTMGANQRAIDATILDMWDYAGARRETIAAEEEFARTGAVTSASLSAASAKLRAELAQQDAQLSEQIATYGKGRAAALEYARDMAIAEAAVKADGTAREKWIATIRESFAPLIEKARIYDSLRESTKRGTQETEAARKAAESYIEKLREEVATYGISEEAKRQLAAASLKLTADQQKEAASLNAILDSHARLTAALTPAYAAIDNLAEGHADLDEQLARQRDALAGLTPAQIEYNAAVREQNALLAQALELGPLTAEQQAEFEARMKKIGEVLGNALDLDGQTESARELESILSRFDDIGLSGLVRDIGRVEAALLRGTDAAGNAFSDAQIARMRAALGGLRQEALVYATDALGEGITSLKSMATEGSKAYAALEVAQTALNLATAIGAIANQGMGDPYTAFARIAAMAAMMSQLVDGIGALSGGGGISTNSASYRQEHQGTGTVLGDASAKSESIARAVEITASATSQLVGINRSMLNALNAMQAGLSGASTLLTRGAGDLTFAGAQNMDLSSGVSTAIVGVTTGLIGLVTDALFGGLLTKVLNKVIGGKSKVTDEGIVILGGVLSDMIENMTVGAYQEVQSRSWWFGSTHTNTEIQQLGDDVAVQFQMVLNSMADTVRAAAQALGLNMDEINARIAAFRIEEIRISTMGLTGEEAQAELEAAFSAIFDGLAGAVVPFIDQFQEVGEGLAETLIRVATSVQVAQEAVIQLGFALDETDPERMAQISVGLMDLMGGVDEFVEGMSSFVNAFATDEHKFSVAQDALTRAFAQAGIAIPESRDAMWALMQSLDATTESGREQIAMLLQMADVSDAYYSMLEDRAATMASIDAAIADGAWQQYLDGLTDGQRAIEETARYYDDWTAQLIANGATVEQLAAVEEQRAVAMARNYATQAEALASAEASYVDFVAGIWRETVQLSDYQSAMADAEEWRASAIEQANELARAAGMAGASEQALALIELRASQMRAVALAQLREETQSLVDQLYGASGDSIGDAFTAGMESASTAAADFWEAQRRAAVTLQEYLDGMLLGDLSALTPAEQLAEAWSQLNAAVADGDADAATSLADTYLRLLRDYEASGEDYNSGFYAVRELLQGMLDSIGPLPDVVDSTASTSATSASASATELDAASRLDLAVQLARHLADLSDALGESVYALSDDMGVSLRSLAADLGVDLRAATGETVMGLVNMAELLGSDLQSLTGELGLSLSQLGPGVRELAAQLGVDVSALTAGTTAALGSLANTLGLDLAELGQSVGADLGSLADTQSLLNAALAETIGQLPDGQRRALESYFEDVREATTAADANDAIDAMADYINTLAPDIRNALAPYFEDVFPADALSDLDYLTSIDTRAAAMADALDEANSLLSRIADNAMSANNAAGIPSYAVGTYNVPQTGPAILHAGEIVLPVPMANAWRAGSVGSVGSDNGAMLAELQRIVERLDRLDRTTAGGAHAISTAVAVAAQESDRNNDQSRQRVAATTQRRGRSA